MRFERAKKSWAKKVGLITGCLLACLQIFHEGDARGQDLPDLQVVQFSSDDNRYFVSKTYIFSAEVQVSGLEAGASFQVSVVLNGEQIYSDTVTPGSASQQFFFSTEVTFAESGLNRLVFTADAANQITESNEENNRSILNLNVLAFETIARPNPFTPNNDGFNDEITFTVSDEFGAAQPEVSIFTLSGKKVLNLPSSGGNTATWDGRNDKNEQMTPGTYFYIIKVDGTIIHRGSILLAL